MKLTGYCPASWHSNLYQISGKAAEYSCVDCGGQAKDWSQTHGTDGCDSEHYNPRCRSCHLKYDMPYTRRAEGHPWTEEAKIKVRESMRARCQDPEYRQKMIARRMAQPDVLSEEDWQVIESTLHLPYRHAAERLGLSVKQVENARQRLRKRKKGVVVPFPARDPNKPRAEKGPNKSRKYVVWYVSAKKGGKDEGNWSVGEFRGQHLRSVHNAVVRHLRAELERPELKASEVLIMEAHVLPPRTTLDQYLEGDE